MLNHIVYISNYYAKHRKKKIIIPAYLINLVLIVSYCHRTYVESFVTNYFDDCLTAFQPAGQLSSL